MADLFVDEPFRYLIEEQFQEKDARSPRWLKDMAGVARTREEAEAFLRDTQTDYERRGARCWWRGSDMLCVHRFCNYRIVDTERSSSRPVAADEMEDW